jgi:hypothetical protein
MRLALLLAAGALALHSSVATATEWLNCASANHGLDVLVGGSTGAGSIEGFEFYRWNTKPNPSMDWTVGTAEIDLSKQTVRFEAKGKNKERPDIALSAVGKKASLKIGTVTEEAKCDWSQLEGVAQQGVPADGPRPAGSARR